MSPLISAVMGNDVKAVRNLIEQGADVNEELWGTHVIHYATHNSPILTMLVEKGAKLNVTNTWGGTLMHTAAEGGYVDSAALLLAHGADPHAQNREGLTPLQVATEQGKLEFVSFLLANGVDINEEGRGNINSLFVAVETGDLDIVKFIVEKGANVNPAPPICPIHLALRNKHFKIVEFLYSKGARISVPKYVRLQDK